MVTVRKVCMLGLLAATSSCGSRRVAGYLDELEGCSATTGATDGPATTESSGPGDDTSSSSTSSTGTTADAATTSSDTADTIGTNEATDTSDTASTIGTTGDDAPECGNGVIEADAPEPEECDDGNLIPDDGCSDTCARDLRVFITSAFYQAGELQSLPLADTLCANLADDQGWPDAIKFRAWLSDSTTDARDRFTKGRGRLVMINGLVLAESWDALLAGQLQNNFEVSEKSETVVSAVWTGTRPDGTAVPGAEHCDGWSTTSFQKTGHYGWSDSTTPEWTLSGLFDNPSGCNSQNHLYCLQSL